jgi:phage virion morphogenesis protein
VEAPVMAGAQIKITVKDKPVTDALARLVRGGGPLIACLKNIGVALVKSTRARFAAQAGPDGKPWAKLNPDYAKGKRGPKILQEHGHLLGSIVYQLTGRRLAVGTNLVYGAIHQFGGVIVPRSASALVFRMGGHLVFARKVTIPARPYLGVSPGDQKTILGIIQDHAEEAWSGR